MARRKGRRGHRRIRCKAYQRKGKWIARRVNPSIPAPIGAAIAAAVGAAGGVGLSFGADKLGIGSPTMRNWGLFAAGLALAAVGHKFAPGPSAAVGAGVGAIGLLRATQTMLYAQPQSAAVSGYGTGDGADISSAFAALTQGGGVFDRIGAVVQDMDGVYRD